MDAATISFLGNASYAMLGIAFVALPFLVVNWVRHLIWVRKSGATGAARWAKYPVKSLLFFVIPFVAFLAMGAYITHTLRVQVLAFLNDLPAQHQVLVNDKPAPAPEAILAALKTLARRAAHHSGPTSTIRIEVRANGNSLKLQLGRDSQDAHEYWVFDPAHPVTGQDEIGRISTPLLDGY